MVGRSVVFRTNKEHIPPGDACLRVHNVSALGEKRLPALRNVSLEVHNGEIFGIAGVAGNGQKELAEIITGLRRCTGGRVELGGKSITNASPRACIDAGIAYIPENRIRTGSVGSLSVTANIALKHYRRLPGIFLQHRALRQMSQSLVAAFNVDTPSIDTRAGTLSGGNLQKLILARELTTKPRLIVAAHPTQGLDVGAAEAVRNRLLEQQKQGVAVLLISEDLDELFSLSDRIGVLYEGQLVGVMATADATRETIGLMMTGK